MTGTEVWSQIEEMREYFVSAEEATPLVAIIDKALAAERKAARSEAFEEAAKIAENSINWTMDSAAMTASEIARLIRARAEGKEGE